MDIIQPLCRDITAGFTIFFNCHRDRNQERLARSGNLVRSFRLNHQVQAERNASFRGCCFTKLNFTV